MWGSMKRILVLVAFLSGVVFSIQSSIAANWDGDGTSGNFDWWNNYYGDSFPGWNSSTPLYFNYNNSGQSTLTQNIGYRSVQSIIYESTFTGNTTLNGSDGFDMYWKVENNDTGSHTINVPLVIQGTLFELNPISGNLTIGGGINNFNNRTLQVYGNGGNTLTLNTAVNGSGGLTVEQNSIVLLNTAQGYTGNTTINAGEVRLGAANRISDSSALVVNSGGTMNLNNFNETVSSMSLASGGNLSLGTGQLIVNGAAGTWAGTISGSAGGSVVKKGAGTVSITGNNSGMAGDWYLVAGTTGMNNNDAAGSGIIYLGETSGSDAASMDISVNGVTIANNIVVRSGSGGNKTIDQAVGGSGTVTFSGDVTLNDTLYATAASGETLVFSGDIGGGSKLVKAGGAGTVTLSGNNSYSGNTEIDNGTLNIAGDISGSSHLYLGNGGNSDDAVLELSGSGVSIGSFDVNSSAGSGTRTINATAGNHAISGTTTVNRDTTINATAGTLTFSGNVDLDNASDYDLNINANGGNVTISGTIIADTGASVINKSGANTLSIAGNNSGSSYLLNIAGGTVALNSANALGTAYSDKVNFTGSGTLDVNADVAPSGLGIRVANGATGTIDVNNGNTFTVGGALANISGVGTFTKIGNGTLQLDGASSYSGTFNHNGGTTEVNDQLTASSGININAGTMNVALGAAIGNTTLNAGTLNVAGSAGSVTMNGGTLSGDGNVGTLVVGSGAVLSPGNSPGTLAAGNTTWDTGGTYLWEINDVDAGAGNDPGWDLLDVTGTLTINAGFTVDVTSLTLANAAGAVNDFDGTQDYIWTIATASVGVTPNATPTINLSGFSNPYQAGAWSITFDANNVYLNYDYDPLGPGLGGGGDAVPEPNALSLATLAGLLLVSLRYRLKRAQRTVVATA